MREPSWAVPLIGFAIAGVLSTGVATAATRDVRDPAPAPLPTAQAGPEVDTRALHVAPGGTYRAASAGKQVQRDGPLAELGFRGGWTRTWRNAGKERVDVFVLEFTTDTGAASYARGIGSAARLLLKPVPFSVGVPGSAGLADTVKDRDGMYAQVVSVHRGRLAALLFFVNKESMPSAEISALAQRQYDALVAT